MLVNLKKKFFLIQDELAFCREAVQLPRLRFKRIKLQVTENPINGAMNEGYLLVCVIGTAGSRLSSRVDRLGNSTVLLRIRFPSLCTLRSLPLVVTRGGSHSQTLYDSTLSCYFTQKPCLEPATVLGCSYEKELRLGVQLPPKYRAVGGGTET